VTFGSICEPAAQPLMLMLYESVTLHRANGMKLK
jgi:hypothetical protein